MENINKPWIAHNISESTYLDIIKPYQVLLNTIILNAKGRAFLDITKEIEKYSEELNIDIVDTQK